MKQNHTKLHTQLIKICLILLLGVTGLNVSANDPANNPNAISEQSRGLIDINTGTADELISLPGIGPTKAAAILSFIDEHGPFRSIEEITMVKGIGLKTLENIRPYITVTR
ncbi:MAG: ComEA family DNA-binding protein [Oceanobacter sp.]